MSKLKNNKKIKEFQQFLIESILKFLIKNSE